MADLLVDLDTFYIGDYKIRQLIDLTRLKLRSVVVDELPIEATPKVEELLIGENTHLPNLHKFNPHLVDFAQQHPKVLVMDNGKCVHPQNHVLQLTKFKFVFSLDMALNAKLVRLIDWEKITQLELILAYTPRNDDDYVIDCFNLIPQHPISRNFL